MSNVVSERVRMAGLGWLATIATSLSFFPALEDKDFLFLAALFNGLVVLAGIGLRALRVPTVLVVLGQAVVLFELLLMRFGDDLWLGLLPTADTFAGIEAILRSGADVAQAYAAPAPSNEGLLLMVVFAITLIGLLVDFIAVSLHRVPLAGLPLLALYTIPVAVLPDGVPFIAFIAGGAAYVAMLMADERDRLTHWGRLVSRQVNPSDPTRIDTSGLNATGRRVSVIALAAAVVLPVVLPTLPSSILDGSGSGGEGGPGSTLSFEDPMVGLARSLHKQDPVDIMRVDVDSGTEPEYIRLVALDNASPGAWKARPLTINEETTSSLTNILPAPIGLSNDVQRVPDKYTIELTSQFPKDSRWLPVAYNASQVEAGGDFAYVKRDQTVVLQTNDENAIREVSPYTVNFGAVDPTPAQLRASNNVPNDLPDLYTEVPGDLPDVVAQTAESLTADADSNYDKALILQSFFRAKGNFTYDLDAEYGYGYNAMGRFLEERSGYCQHFAATMAMMARTLGIPSRVVVGFLKPENKVNDEWVFTTDNVHAWPELFFEGVGWVRFEPTPGVEAGYPAYAPRTAGPTATSALPTETGPTAPAETRPERTAETDAAAGANDSGSGSGSGPFLSAGWLILAGLLLVIFAPAALRAAVRRSRLRRPLEPTAAAESAWLELRDHVRDLRLPWTGSMTPRARERAVAPLLYGNPEGLAALHRLALNVERARYAPTLGPDADPASDASEVMDVISREADRKQRMLAFFLPASLLPDIRTGWQSVRQRLSWRRATT